MTRDEVAFLTGVKWSLEELSAAVILLYMFCLDSLEVSSDSVLSAFDLSLGVDITVYTTAGCLPQPLSFFFESRLVPAQSYLLDLCSVC